MLAPGPSWHDAGCIGLDRKLEPQLQGALGCDVCQRTPHSPAKSICGSSSDGGARVPENVAHVGQENWPQVVYAR